MHRISLVNLEAFVAAARYDSLRAAAERTAVSVAAISIAIKRLEGQLGYDLFERHGIRLHLTPAGEELLARAQPALSALKAVMPELDDDGSPEDPLTIQRPGHSPQLGKG